MTRFSRGKGFLLLGVLLGPAVLALAAAQGSDSSPAAGVPPGAALLSVEAPTPQTADELLSAGFWVVRDMGRYLLVLAEPGEIARRGPPALNWRVLDLAPSGKSYYTVTPGNEAGLRADGIRVLRLDPYGAVIEAAPEAAERLVGRGCEIARVFLRPVRAPRAAPPPGRGVLAAGDSLIQSMVDAVSISNINAQVQRLRDFRTRYCTTDSCLAAAHYIRSRFLSYGIDSVYFHHFSELYKDNVVAVIPGVIDPTQVVIIGGHYDSISYNLLDAPGADDNASGAAAVLECARVMAGHPFEHTLVFVTFCAEELGLYGSEAYARDAAARGDNIVAMLNCDMLGYLSPGDSMDLDIISNASSAWIRDLIISVGAQYVPSFSVVPGYMPGGASSDHASFWAYGYDAVLFFEDSELYSPFIHTPNDIIGLSYNCPSLAEGSIRVALGTLATLAEPFRISLVHTPLPDTADTLHPYRVTATIRAAAPLVPDSLRVYVSTAWGADTLSLTPTGQPNEYEAYIPAQANGTVVDYYMLARDTSGNRATSPREAPAETHSFYVGTFDLFTSQDFEGANGWTVGAPDDDATSGIWEWADPVGSWWGTTPVQPEDDHTPAPGLKCYVTGNAPPGAYQGENDVDDGKTTLFSPIFNLSGKRGARVRYYRWYTNDTGGGPGTDQWVVDASPDAGASWVRLETMSGSNRNWELVERDLHDFIPLTSQVCLRFIASDYYPGSIVEAAIDDFSILTYRGLPTDVAAADGGDGRGPAGGDGLWLGPNAPNPCHPETVIRFRVPAPGRRVTLSIHDVTGRRIATPVQDEWVEGAGAVRWDGRDQNGREVAAGVYYYRLDAGAERRSAKLVVVR